MSKENRFIKLEKYLNMLNTIVCDNPIILTINSELYEYIKAQVKDDKNYTVTSDVKREYSYIEDGKYFNCDGKDTIIFKQQYYVCHYPYLKENEVVIKVHNGIAFSIDIDVDFINMVIDTSKCNVSEIYAPYIQYDKNNYKLNKGEV